MGPFSKESIGTTATGYSVGGTGWYRKTFVLNEKENFKKTINNFDRVYMNSNVWINGKLIGSHPYGYTAFQFDITDILNPAGQSNVIAVKNKGKNSRWYSGSGIYRHVWLIQKQAVSVAHNRIFITKENISPDKASIKITSTIDNVSNKKTEIKLLINIIGSDGQVSQSLENQTKTISSDSEKFIQNITIQRPVLGSVESPNIYTAEIKVVAYGKVTDKVTTTFGIRTIHFDAQTGFTLNGKNVLLKGGCMHHDNGFLGLATIDRAEERRVELMKANGFNAKRTSHNPPSRQFLDACDQIGVFVMDEAFDMWERAKNPEDYHLYFKKWWNKNLESMVLRDRNHPSVIMWSIGNEINERADSIGYILTKKLSDKVHRLDPTCPVTEAICGFWDHPGKDWSTTAPAFASLDVGGYNYLREKYEPDHVLFPNRIMTGTESFPGDIFKDWRQVEKNVWVIGDFAWTAMDYLGETGLGNARQNDDPDKGFIRSWPWFNAFCGDLDLCGDKKPQLLYGDVIWDNSKLEMVVHSPVPDGKREIISYWCWTNESQSWNWDGYEGQMMNVRVFAGYPAIRPELNDKIIAEQQINEDAKYIANFKVLYESGILKAVALENGTELATKELRTTGKPAKIKLTADRSTIKADRNDLSYVKVEITDTEGNIIPDTAIPVTFKVSGIDEIAGSGNACPYDMESFNNQVCKTYHGRALVILRPVKNMKTGMISFLAESNGPEAGELNITI